MSKSELACAYAALMLADDEVDVTADKISTIIKAANIKFVEPYLPGLFASALQGKNVKDLLSSVGAPGGGAPVAAVAAAPTGGSAPAASEKPKEEEKKKEESEDSDDDFNLDLFG